MVFRDELHSRLPLLLRRCILGLALPFVLVVGQLSTAAPASAATVVNTTFDVPAQVLTNPCFQTDIVELSGSIHVVITATGDSADGYRINDHLNSQLAGVSLTTATRYVNSENQDDEWYARPPFPVIHTNTYDFVLVSQGNTPNYVLQITMHETVNADGVVTATVDNYSLRCQG